MDRLLLRFFLTFLLALGLACGVNGRALAQEAQPAHSGAAVVKKGDSARAFGAASQASKPHKKHKEKAQSNRGGVHARAWAFGGGGQSRDAWRGGASTGDLQKRAVVKDAPKGETVNTTSGIDSALKASENKNASGLGVSVGQDESSWRRKTPSDVEAPDENLPMQSRHVVRAFADVDAGDDLNISLGPELILKDEQRERAAANKEPDSTLGMGMRFKLDF